MIVDRFDREDVWPVPDKEYRDQLAILDQIKVDLFRLMDSPEPDVREAIKKATFGEYLRAAMKVSAADRDIDKEADESKLVDEQEKD